MEMEVELRVDNEYLFEEPQACEAMNRIRLLVNCQSGKLEYRCISEPDTLMETLRSGNDRLMKQKRDELREVMHQCRGVIHRAIDGNPKLEDIGNQADQYYAGKERDCRRQNTQLSRWIEKSHVGIHGSYARADRELIRTAYDRDEYARVEGESDSVEKEDSYPVSPDHFPCKNAEQRVGNRCISGGEKKQMVQMLKEYDEIKIQ